MDFDCGEIETISYSQIFERARSYDHSTVIAVSLNRYHAWLFRSKFELLTGAGERYPFFQELYDGVKLLMILILTITTAPQLSALTDFYERDNSVRNRVRFVPSNSRQIVYFLPRK